MISKFIEVYNFLLAHKLIGNEDRVVDIIRKNGQIGIKLKPYDYFFYEIEEENFPFDFMELDEEKGTCIDISNGDYPSRLRNLKGLPYSAPRLSLSLFVQCELESLEGCPRALKSLSIYNCNNLSDSENLPEYVNNLRIKGTKIENFYNTVVGNQIELKGMNVKSFVGLDIYEHGNITLSNMKKLDLSYFPKCDQIGFDDCTFSDISGLIMPDYNIRYGAEVFPTLDRFKWFLDTHNLWEK